MATIPVTITSIPHGKVAVWGTFSAGDDGEAVEMWDWPMLTWQATATGGLFPSNFFWQGTNDLSLNWMAWDQVSPQDNPFPLRFRYIRPFYFNGGGSPPTVHDVSLFGSRQL